MNSYAHMRHDRHILKAIRIAVIRLCLGLLCVACAAGCEMRVEDVMIAMPDDIRLATTLYLPRGDGPWPAILIRTPYSRDKVDMDYYSLAENGIACVVQDTRGRFDSEGKDSVFFAAHQDGQATLTWIAAQPWSNGTIMTTGGSALGIAQYMMAPDAPPCLKFQMIDVATPTLYNGLAFQGGVYRYGLATLWLKGIGSAHMIAPFQEHYLNDAFWDPVQIIDRYDRVHVPALHVGGWYDIVARGTVNAFLGYQYKGGEGAAGRQHLVMGPWHHGIGDSIVGQLIFPKTETEPNEQIAGLAIRACLLNDTAARTELDATPPVHYFTMGAVGEADAPGNAWHSAESWPPLPEECPPTLLYLHPQPGETRIGQLNLDPPDNDAQGYTFSYNPYDPAPTIGGANLILARGSYDQRDVEIRDDVLVYTSELLTQPVEVTGDLQAHIWITTNAVDTDIAVRLTDVYPDNRSMLVCDSIARTRFHNSPDFSFESFVPAGEPVLLTLDLGPGSIIFNTGHRIRISVTSSNAPRFAPNPNNGDVFLDDTNGRVARTTVLHDVAHPSALILPLKIINGSNTF